MLNVGDKVPDFTLPLAKADGTKEVVSFRALANDSPVVIGFFPLAFTGVCTTQVCEMLDPQSALDSLGAKVVGFSIDTPFTNIQFAKANNLQHGIFSDPNREVVDQIWSTMDIAGVKRVATRGWIVVDKTGTVIEKWEAPAPGDWSGMKPIEAALLNAQ